MRARLCPRSWGEGVDPRPHFRWGPPLQMIVGPGVVVPGAHIPQDIGEISLVRDRLCHQRPFHRTDEPFHLSVLPGTAKIRAVMADA